MEKFLLKKHFSSKIALGNLFSLTAENYSIEMNDIVIQSILRFQRKFFITGELKDIKTMKLEDIAKICKKDISLVSRILKNKYLLKSGKIILLSELLNSGSVINNNGEQISKYELIEFIKNVIINESPDCPLGDRIISETINQYGFNISREVVKKYRIKYLDLPSSIKRKQIY